MNVEEPTEEEAIRILEGIKGKYEEHHKVTITPEAVNAAEDPDGLIGAEIAKLVAAAHISYEAKEKPPAPGADNTAQVAE